MTTWLIYTEARTFPKFPAYEGADVVIAARTVIDAADANKEVTIRCRYKGKVMRPIGAEIPPLTDEIKRQRRLQPK